MIVVLCCSEAIKPQNPELYGLFLNSSPKRGPKFSIRKLKFSDLVILISFAVACLDERFSSRLKIGVFTPGLSASWRVEVLAPMPE